MASASKVPSGFVRVGSVADAPWFILENGNTLQGKLLGVFTRDDKRAKSGKSKFFQVQLSAPCKLRSGRGEDVKVYEGTSGTIVNLNITPLTRCLEDFCAKILRGGEYNVFAPCGEKKPLANGNDMWLIDTHVQVVREPEALEDQEPDFGGDAAAPAGE
jgi:hypothetical protein